MSGPDWGAYDIGKERYDRMMSKGEGSPMTTQPEERWGMWEKEGPTFASGYEEWHVKQPNRITVATCYDEVDADHIVALHNAVSAPQGEEWHPWQDAYPGHPGTYLFRRKVGDEKTYGYANAAMLNSMQSELEQLRAKLARQTEYVEASGGHYCDGMSMAWTDAQIAIDDKVAAEAEAAQLRARAALAEGWAETVREFQRRHPESTNTEADAWLRDWDALDGEKQEAGS